MTTTEPQATDSTELMEVLRQEVAQSEYLTERLAELELALDDQGWARLSMDTDREFSRDGIDRIIALSRLNALKNPLIKRGVGLKAQYVFGQGVEIAAVDDDINETVIQPFLDNKGNKAELFGHQARMRKDRTLTTDGQIVFVLFPNRVTGAVSVRSVDVEEIRDIITNPDDRLEPWFYLRRWTERRIINHGMRSTEVVSREAWYPALGYEPFADPAAARAAYPSIDSIPIQWESPIYHARVGGLEGMRFGIPETYAALDWAKAYKLFLEDWATIVRSLSRFAWKQKVKRDPSRAAARLGSTVGPGARETNPSPATGSVYTHTEDGDLTPIPKTDATINSADGVWLAKMVAAALDLPYTLLMGDPDMGNLATAKTLDRPTELAMMDRQRTWTEIKTDLCDYAIDWAVRAPGGPLAGTVIHRASENRTIVELPDETIDGETITGGQRRTIQVSFPPILESDPKDQVEAITMAFGTELPAPKTILRLLLLALGLDDVDDLVAAFDEEAWKAERANLGQGLTDAFRRGEDPAAALA